jgi:hypothetical protein
MRRETSRVSVLMCPFCVRDLLSVLKNTQFVEIGLIDYLSGLVNHLSSFVLASLPVIWAWDYQPANAKSTVKPGPACPEPCTPRSAPPGKRSG